MHDGRRDVTSPSVLALWTAMTGLPVAVHDGLEYGCERSDSNSGAYQDSVLCAEYVRGGGSVWTIQVYLINKNVDVLLNELLGFPLQFP